MALDRLLGIGLLLITPWLLLEVLSRVLLNARSTTSSFTKRTWSLTWETTALNALPTRTLRLLRCFPSGRDGMSDIIEEDGDERQDRNSKERGILVRFYDLGVYFAALSLLLALLVLVWGALQLFGDLYTLRDRVQPLPKLSKRDVPTTPSPEDVTTWAPAIVPLIPGITVPLFHAVPILLGLCFAQVIHEAGHALCAALHKIQPTSMGIVLFFPIIPAAFVALPEDEYLEDDRHHHLHQDRHRDLEEEAADEARHSRRASVSNRQRLRIVSAGVWHNAVSAGLVVILFNWLGFSSFLVRSLWVPTQGVRVTGVDASSPLSQHIQANTGSLITHLDDVDLAGGNSRLEDPLERWNDFLLKGKDEAPRMGWCVPQTAWQASSTLCCDRLKAPSSANSTTTTTLKRALEEDLSSQLCFVNLETASTVSNSDRCYDPSLLVSGSSKALQRCTSTCTSDASTSEGRVCIASHPDEQLIRISVQEEVPTMQEERGNAVTDKTKTTRVVLFQGSRLAIYYALDVTTYTPRYAFLPLPPSLISYVKLCIDYFVQLSWALALLNMLPLPSLDGDSFLALALREVLLPVAYLPLRRRRQRRRKTQMGKTGSSSSSSSGGDTRNERAAQSTSRPIAMALRRPPNGGGTGSTSFDVDIETDFATPSPSHRTDAENDDEQSGDEEEDLYEHEREEEEGANRTAFKVAQRARWLAVLLATFVLGGNVVLAFIHL